MTNAEATMPDAEQPELCTHRPRPGERTDLSCETCGHHILLHVGVEHCPVCKLVQHNRRVRAAMAANRIEIHVTGVDERTLDRAIERISLRAATRNPARYVR